MNKVKIFEIEYDVDEDGNIQIGEELIKVVDPRNLAKVIYQQFPYPDVKAKKPSQADFGSVVESLHILTKKGFVDDQGNMNRPYNKTQLAKALDVSRNTFNPYQKALDAINKTKPDESEITIPTKEKEKFVEMKRKNWMKQYGHLVNRMKDEMKRPAGERQLQTYEKAEPVLFRLFQKDVLGMTPNQFLQKDVDISSKEKFKKLTAWLNEAREKYHEAGKLQAEKEGREYVGANWKNDMAVMRKFIEIIGEIPIPKPLPAAHPLMQNIKRAGYGGKSLVGKYAHLDATPTQVIDLQQCLKEVNEDAYLLFKLNLELGLRELEALSIDALPPRPDASGVKEETVEGKKVFIVTVRTRKGDWTGDRIHTGLVRDPELVEAISKRVNQVKEGIKQKTQKAADKFGVVLETLNPHTHKMQLNKDHSLIGADNLYYDVWTLQNPKPKRAKDTKPYDKLLNDLRECYTEVGLTDDYFQNKPLHSMRHIFAHYWLIKTSYDYEFVADLGHWKATTELKRSYGAQPKQIFFAKVIAYGDKDHLTVDEWIQKNKEEGFVNEAEKVMKNDMPNRDAKGKVIEGKIEESEEDEE